MRLSIDINKRGFLVAALLVSLLAGAAISFAAVNTNNPFHGAEAIDLGDGKTLSDIAPSLKTLPTGAATICTSVNSGDSNCADGGVGSSQWIGVSGGPIYYNGGNVGIGTTNPQAPLDVQTRSGGGWNDGIRLEDYNSNVNAFQLVADTAGLTFGYNGANLMSIGRSGNIGIGGNIQAADVCTTSGKCLANPIDSAGVSFNYAEGLTKGGAATGVACTTCVDSAEVSFNYAGSTFKGGAATDGPSGSWCGLSQGVDKVFACKKGYNPFNNCPPGYTQNSWQESPSSGGTRIWTTCAKD